MPVNDILQCNPSFAKNAPQAFDFSRNSVTGNKKVDVEKGPRTHVSEESSFTGKLDVLL